MKCVPASTHRLETVRRTGIVSARVYLWLGLGLQERGVHDDPDCDCGVFEHNITMIPSLTVVFQ